MLFNSLSFLIFFPIVVVLYYAIPHRLRWILLLIASYYFYMSWNPKYAVLIAFSTITTYITAILIEKANQNIFKGILRVLNNKKLLVALGLGINLAILFIFKYYNFLNATFKEGFSFIGLDWDVPNFSFLLPVGISFYTFQALGYIIDVYRGDKKAERHIGIYSLYVSFFPQLVAGPIERSTHLLPQFYKKIKFNYENIKSGLLLMLWGFFQKVVIADRLSILVNEVYNNSLKYEGFQLVVATFFFSIQILCDFAGYSDIAIGASRVFGFDLMKNFKRPYFAASIKEFWQRWHISLSTWFRDYLYIPLGGNRGSRWFNYRNLIIVFVVSGLWHGANWTFIIWGFLHGVYIVGEYIIKTYSNPYKFIGIKDKVSLRVIKTIIVFSLVSFAWIFFRANNIRDALYISTGIFKFNPEILFTDALYKMGLDKQDFWMALYSIFILFIVHFLQEKFNILKEINKLWLPFRWGIYLAVIFFILIFGAYGNQYNAADFIYFQF